MRISALRVKKRVNIHLKMPSPLLFRVLILYKSKRKICVFCAGEHLMFTRKCLIDSLLFGVVKGEGKNRNLLSARTRALRGGFIGFRQLFPPFLSLRRSVLPFCGRMASESSLLLRESCGVFDQNGGDSTNVGVAMNFFSISFGRSHFFLVLRA